jgi:serine/threonine protein kinase
MERGRLTTGRDTPAGMRSFRFLETLGEGSFGSVFLAEVRDDEGFSQRLAVKMLHAAADADEDVVGRLRDEARLLALLHHENVVRVHGLTRVDGRLAVLMEPVVGFDLSEVAGTAAPARAVLQVGEAVADALHAAVVTPHPETGRPLCVVHRDIKPSNVMVTDRGIVKVLDFGVARATFDAREASTRSQQFGTARYMAPERWLHGSAEAPSDVFSLGVTLVELWRGAPVARFRLARAAFEQDVATALDGAPPAVAAFFASLLSFDADQRPDAATVAARCRVLAADAPGSDLRTWAQSVGPQVRDRRRRAAAPSGSHDEEIAATLATPPAPGPRGEPARRIPGAVWLAAAMAAALLAGGISRVSRTTVRTPAAAPVAVDVATPTSPPSVTPEDAAPAVAAPRDDVAADPIAATPTPVRPAPAPPRDDPPTVAPAPGPTAAPLPTSTAPPVAVTFVLDPPDLDAHTDEGPVAHRVAALWPRGVHEVRLDGARGPWRCTVRVDGPTATFRVVDAGRTCQRVQ